VHQGLHGEALERYRDARRFEGTHVRAMMGEVRALIALDRAVDARPVAEDLLGAAPDDIDVLLLAATARAESGDPDAALSALSIARRVAPQRADVAQKIGDVRRLAGDRSGARASYYEALALDGDLAVVRFELAKLLVGDGADPDAEAELLAALDAVPTYVDASLELAQLWRRTGRREAAMRVAIELLERDMTLTPALLALGEILFELGRRKDAALAFARLRRMEPSHPAALYYEGALFAEQHRFREAIERWEKVVEIEPDGPYGRRARRDGRTASDLAKIFTNGARVNGNGRP
jgi:tetratricopeptide (TPR) repeat protein